MYCPRPNPPILSPIAAQFSVVSAPNRTFVASADLPADLRDAVAKRRNEFAAGRYCAREAIARLDGRRRGETLGRGADGAPIWPAGLRGSITHTEGFVSAAVARADRVDGLGIDTERIVTAEVADEIAAFVARAGEVERVMIAAGLDREASLSLCFSAKETTFKCLYPLARRFFDYRDAEIVEIDSARGDFAARLCVGLAADLPAGLVLKGRYAIDPPFIHSGMTFCRPRPCRSRC